MKTLFRSMLILIIGTIVSITYYTDENLGKNGYT